MRLITPSWIAYVTVLLHSLKIINATIFWPYIKITSMLGIILLSLIFTDYSLKSYKKIFYLPFYESFPKYTQTIAIIFILFKILLLIKFPKNNTYSTHCYLFLLCYIIGAFIINASYQQPTPLDPLSQK